MAFGTLVFLWAGDELIEKEGSLVRFESPVPGLGSEIVLKVVKLDPPFLFWGDTPLSGEPPFWATTPLWALNLTDKLVPLKFDPAYLAEYGAPRLQRPAPPIYLAVYFGIHVAVGGEEYLFVGSAFGEDKTKLSPKGVGVATSGKHGHRWKRTAPPKWSSVLHWNDLAGLELICRTGAARLDRYNKLEPLP